MADLVIVRGKVQSVPQSARWAAQDDLQNGDTMASVAMHVQYLCMYCAFLSSYLSNAIISLVHVMSPGPLSLGHRAETASYVFS